MNQTKVTYGKLSQDARTILAKRNSQSLAAGVAPMQSNVSWRVKFAYICFVVSLIAMIGSCIMGLYATGETRVEEEYSYSYYASKPSYRKVHVPDPMQGVYFQTGAELFGCALFILFVASPTKRLEAIAARRDNLKEQWDFYALVMYIGAAVTFMIGLVTWANTGGIGGFLMFLMFMLFESIPLCLARVTNIVKSLYLDEYAQSPASLSKDGEADILKTLCIAK